MKNIISIFAGRQKNLEILKKYLDKALELNIIDEVHIWNYTRNETDEKYIKSISNLKRCSSRSNKYTEIFTPIINNEFYISVKASNDIYIKILDLFKLLSLILFKI